MSLDIGIAPDPVAVLYRHVLRLFPDADHDMIHLHHLPDGYNCHTHGLAVVVLEDVAMVDDTAHSRDLVKVNVFGPEHALVRRLGRNLYMALTQGMTGVGLGVSRSKSRFFGSAPSHKPTGFVATMSISVGVSKLFADL